MIVPTQNDGGAMGSSTTKVCVLKNIAAAVHPWSLAIPDAIYPLDPSPREQVHQLAAHHRSRREFFVDRRLMHNMVRFEKLAGTRQGQIVAGEWRAFVAGNKGPGVESCPCVTTLLIERQTHQSLNTSQIDTPCGYGVFIVERHFHGGFLPDARTSSTQGCLATQLSLSPLRLDERGWTIGISHHDRL